MQPESKPPPFERIAEKLDAFSARQRSLLRSTAFFTGLGCLGLGICVMAIEAQLDAPLNLVVGTGVVFLVVILSVLGMVVGVRSLQSRSRIRQAQRVESLNPDFRMRLNTVVEEMESSTVGTSHELLEWTAERALGGLESIEGFEIYPSRPLRKAAVFFVLCGGIWMSLDQWGDPGPSGLLRWIDQRGAGAEVSAVETRRKVD